MPHNRTLRVKCPLCRGTGWDRIYTSGAAHLCPNCEFGVMIVKAKQFNKLVKDLQHEGTSPLSHLRQESGESPAPVKPGMFRNWRGILMFSVMWVAFSLWAAAIAYMIVRWSR